MGSTAHVQNGGNSETRGWSLDTAHGEARSLKAKNLFWDLPFSEARSLKLYPGLDF